MKQEKENKKKRGLLTMIWESLTKTDGCKCKCKCQLDKNKDKNKK